MTRDPAERFWEKVAKAGPDDCWDWRGTSRKDYGVFWDGARQVQAHRWAYESLVAPIPVGLCIDHLCRNRSCVNPAHMEVVTNRENILRGTSPSAHHAKVTHCPSGHEYTSENTYVHAGKRYCKTCVRGRRTATPNPERCTCGCYPNWGMADPNCPVHADSRQEEGTG